MDCNQRSGLLFVLGTPSLKDLRALCAAGQADLGRALEGTCVHAQKQLVYCST